jgi:hypothetical protein
MPVEAHVDSLAAAVGSTASGIVTAMTSRLVAAIASNSAAKKN